VLFRYSRWDGTQRLPDLDADDVLAALADDLLADGDVARALRELARRGFRTREGEQVPGLADLAERLRQERQALLDRHRMDDVLADLRERLADVLRTERAGIERRREEARQLAEAGANPEAEARRQAFEQLAAERQARLDGLPADLGGAVAGLQDYPFVDVEAWQKFQELMMRLRQEMLQSRVSGLQQAMRGLGPEDLAAMGRMVQDLNRLLREHRAGGQPDLQGFLDRWGALFPGVQTMDQLVAQLERQAAELQSLLESLTPEQRRELEALQEAVLQDAGLQEALAELAEHLERLSPGRPAPGYRLRGDQPLSLQEALRLMGELHDLDRLADQLREAGRAGDLAGVDAEAVRRALGDATAAELEQLRQLARLLEEAGYLDTRGRRLELTPQAIRRIGQRALAEIFGQLRRDRVGPHPTSHRGAAGEPADLGKPYQFGDPFLLDLEATLRRALERQGPGLPLRLQAADFQVRQTELSTRCATVVLLDMSRSMIYRDCWQAAKKVALALDSLIRTQYPRDTLHVVGFSLYAREYAADVLPALRVTERNYGTNMQHALQLARQLLGRYRGGNRQVIMITDGEPTAHLEGAEAYYEYPTTRRTWQLTRAEVGRCTREGIVINTFMLEDSPGLQAFVAEMARINRGRALFVSPDRLGEYVVIDYLAGRQRRVG
jgi:uncharacterized protein with von Willebrand factor type A (vWA) domain